MTTYKQTSTTVFACILLSLAGLGLIISLAGLFMVSTIKDDLIPQSSYLVDSILSIVSKIGLAAVGVSLIVRFRHTIAVGAVALLVSLADSAYYLFVMIGPQTSDLDSARQIGFYFGASLTTVFSFCIYLGLFVFLALPPTRIEFGRSTPPPPPPIPHA